MNAVRLYPAFSPLRSSHAKVRFSGAVKPFLPPALEHHVFGKVILDLMQRAKLNFWSKQPAWQAGIHNDATHAAFFMASPAGLLKLSILMNDRAQGFVLELKDYNDTERVLKKATGALSPSQGGVITVEDFNSRNFAYHPHTGQRQPLYKLWGFKGFRHWLLEQYYCFKRRRGWKPPQ